MGDWTFFSNHGHVLVCLARDSEARLRDVAMQVGITERAVQKIVRDLQDAGYLEISKHGRRNRYRINNRKAMRHSLQAGVTIGQLLTLLNRQGGASASANVAEKPEPAAAQPEPGPEPISEPIREPRPEPAVQPEPEEEIVQHEAVEPDPEPAGTSETEAKPKPQSEPQEAEPEPRPAEPKKKNKTPDLEQGQLF